jgi:pyruvate kinase
MIKNIRKSSLALGKKCRILMDLGGPKLRTGDIAEDVAVIKSQPKQNVSGQVIFPARILLQNTVKTVNLAKNEVAIPVKDGWLSHVAIGDVVELKDARGARRRIKIIEQVGDDFWAESSQTIYFTPDITLKLSERKHIRRDKLPLSNGKVGEIPLRKKTILLHKGDCLMLTREPILGQPAKFAENGELVSLATISCSLPIVFSMVLPGERILFDDGRIAGVIKEVNHDALLIEITHTRDKGDKLLADKGINLPESNLTLDALTQADIQHLPFVVKHADMVGFSFSKCAKDVETLQEYLKKLDAEALAIVLKVETRAAFEQLPEMLLSLLQSPRAAVMIARGDLAVECGYERMAELQEEILCLADAAHLPLIWATQVLEGVAKTGRPSRAEISDVVMADRAECVMLNKGPHILEAIEMLDDILMRMQSHQIKKKPLLKKLHW